MILLPLRYDFMIYVIVLYWFVKHLTYELSAPPKLYYTHLITWFDNLVCSRYSPRLEKIRMGNKKSKLARSDRYGPSVRLLLYLILQLVIMLFRQQNSDLVFWNYVVKLKLLSSMWMIWKTVMLVEPVVTLLSQSYHLIQSVWI